MSEKTPTVRKNIRDLSNPLELRELNRQMEWIWRKILGGLDERAFSDGGIRQVTTTVEKIVATEMTADTIDTNFLNAAIAKMMVAVIGVCDADYLTAVDANVENLIVRRGLGNSFTFDNLKIVYAQIVSATIGELCVKASDGNYYTLDVDSEGKVTASMATVTDGEISAGHTNAGKVILGTDIVADELSTSDLFATFALVDKIDAARINVDTLVARAAFAEKLFATEAFVRLLRTEKIVGENSIEIIAGQVEQNAQDIGNMEIYTGDNPPPAPLAAGKLWIDTGVTPTVIRRWKGVTLDTLDALFAVTNGSGTSGWVLSSSSGDGIDLVPGNIGVNSTTATITLKAARDLSSVVISGAYYTETGYDKLTLTVAGTTILDAVSGTSAGAQRYVGTLAQGDEIVLKYVKDPNQSAANEASTLFTIASGDWDTVSDMEEINDISNRLIAQQAEAQKAIDQLATAISIDTSGAHFYKPGYRDRSEVRIDQDSVDIVVGGNVNSSFIAGGLILGNYMLWHPEASGGLAFNLM